MTNQEANPYKTIACPICNENAVGSCRCGGGALPHTLEHLKKGHGYKCPNGHNYSSEGLSYDSNILINEGLQDEYYLKQTTPKEVDPLLRKHYLGAEPWPGSGWKDLIWGVYKKENDSEKLINTQDLLVGCIIYGSPEIHAVEYIGRWVRSLLSSSETEEQMYQTIKSAIAKDAEEMVKSKQKGYQYEPKAKKMVSDIFNAIKIKPEEMLELKRLFFLDKYDKKNIESFTISNGNKEILRKHPDVKIIVSFSDSGVGHAGTVYQATNAVYAGKNKSGLHRYLYLAPQLQQLIKKYRKEYEELASSKNYPKAGQSKQYIQRGTDFSPDKALPQKSTDFSREKDVDAVSRDDRKVINTLTNKLKTMWDPKEIEATKNIIAKLQGPEQMKMNLQKNKLKEDGYKTIAKSQHINEYGDTGTGMGQYSAGMSANSVGTFSSPDVSQNGGAFASNHPSMYYPVGANKVDMYNNYRVTGASDEDIKKLKKTVTPDEVIQGLSAILKSQFFKNKSKAKEILVQNLKRDPQYYSSLRYLGIEGPDKQLSETISYKDFYL